jgi:HSP20 family molecular chaperone IbpA
MAAIDRIRVSPEVCSYANEAGDALIIEVSLPGVAKSDVHLHVRDDSMTATALRDDTEFVATLSFCCPVNVDAIQAHYEDGLLRVEAPFRDPLAGSHEIAIT